jgi:hypothetical protein
VKTKQPARERSKNAVASNISTLVFGDVKIALRAYPTTMVDQTVNNKILARAVNFHIKEEKSSVIIADNVHSEKELYTIQIQLTVSNSEVAAQFFKHLILSAKRLF